MRATLLGMLDGRSTSGIEAGLEAVRTGARDRFNFKKKTLLAPLNAIQMTMYISMSKTK